MDLHATSDTSAAAGISRRAWLALALGAGGLGPVWAQNGGEARPATPLRARQWHFDVFLDRRKVGRHEVDLNPQDGLAEVRVRAELEYSMLGVKVYSYQHTATERWDGDCLVAMETHTRENKRELWVQGERKGEGFDLRNRDGETRLPGCVMSAAYWNPRLLTRSEWINPQNGKLLQSKIADRGEGPFTLRGGTVTAHRWEIATKNAPLELWYADGGSDWVGLNTSVIGQTLRYVRV